MQYLRSFLVLLVYRRITAQYVLIVLYIMLVSFRICKSGGLRAFCQESVDVGSGEVVLAGTRSELPSKKALCRGFIQGIFVK